MTVKFFIAIYSVVVIGFATTSCSKSKSRTTSELVEILSSGNPQTPDDSLRNYVVIKLDQTLNAYDSANSYDITSYAQFKDNIGNNVNVGNINVGGEQMLVGTGNFYELPFTGSLFTTGKSFFGNQVQINVAGGGDYPATNKVVYVPKGFITTGLLYPYDRLIRNQNLTLNWVVDQNALFRKVLIQVFYYPALSKRENPGFPNSITSLKVLATDNGQYTILSSSFSAFPIGSYVGLIISRAVESSQIVTSPLSGNQIQIFYYTIVQAKTIPLKVM